MTPTAELPGAISASTLSEALRITARRRGTAPALHDEGLDGGISWTEYDSLADRVAATLHRHGIGSGETVALMLHNRWEFHVLDAGAMRAGIVTVSLYNAATAEQHHRVLRDSGARWLFTEQALAPAREALPKGVELVTVVDDEAASDVPLERLLAGTGDDAEPEPEATPDDLVCLVYTSGTTGEAKGVEIDHRAALRGARGILDAIPVKPDGRVVSYLPMAHVAERACSHYMPMLLGTTVHCCHDPQQVFELLPHVRPTLFFSVPRLWEKLGETIRARMAEQPAEIRQRFERGDEELLAGMRSALGLDQAASLVVGGAATPRAVLDFFSRAGLPLLETWGMAELCAVAAANRPGHARHGSVGQAVGGVELRIAGDGEVLVRSEARLRAYRNRPEETRALIDADGWLRTGDLGELDDDGFLTITGRKKELIVSAQGKNVSPLLVERTLAEELPFAEQVCCIGDERPYLVVLVTVDPKAEDPVERVRAGIERANERLGGAERPRRALVVHGEWTPESGLVTPTLKLRRAAIGRRYANQVDALYRAPAGNPEEILVRPCS